LHRQIRAGLASPEEGTALKTLFNRAEQRLAVLGTLANAAPFVGLLGTVIGIIRAFHTISQASGSGGGMSLVAGGISEALVSTAAGLAVAIPASMIYNYFTFQNEKLMETAGVE
jgi:biopolymer transport protein ExbB